MREHFKEGDVKEGSRGDALQDTIHEALREVGEALDEDDSQRHSNGCHQGEAQAGEDDRALRKMALDQIHAKTEGQDVLVDDHGGEYRQELVFIRLQSHGQALEDGMQGEGKEEKQRTKG